MSEKSAQLEKQSNIWYRLTVVFFIGMFALFAVAQLVYGFASIIIIQTLPLIIFIPGLIHKKHYKTYSWLCFVVLLYFTAYVTEVGSPLMRWTDITGLLLTIGLFISAMMTSRYVQRWQYELALEDYYAQQGSKNVSQDTNEV
ncbi:DUF2069 domain-containing protein [Sessilibacter sp. MAH4]